MPIRRYTSLSYIEKPVADGNFDRNRVAIDRIVIHTTAGTLAGTEARFNNPASQVSAHYIVDLDGTLYAMLEEYNVAYACGNYPMNQRSISIEHVDNGMYNDPRPDTLYKESSRLVADICSFYGIVCDRTHVLKHSEIIATSCPDALDIDRIVAGAANILNTSGSSSVASSTIALDQDHLNAISDLENYRLVRMRGPGGNFQGFVDAIIGSDRDLPGIKEQLIVYQSQTPINATIGGLPIANPNPSGSSPSGIVSSNSILGIAWNWLKGKKTYIISGLIIGWSQLKAMGYIDDATYQVGLSVLGALGLAAIRMGMSNN